MTTMKHDGKTLATNELPDLREYNFDPEMSRPFNWKPYVTPSMLGAAGLTTLGIAIAEAAHADPMTKIYVATSLPAIGAALGAGYKWLTSRGK